MSTPSQKDLKGRDEKAVDMGPSVGGKVNLKFLMFYLSPWR
jgi:hypothetical protein